jgi:hypothetical protein
VWAAIAEWIRHLYNRNSLQKTLLSMLLDLPVEILSEILVLLDYLSILHCSTVNFPFLVSLFLSLITVRSSKQVCRQLHVLIATSLNLQYRIELAAEGLIDGPPGGPASTTAARMDLLLERRVAWRALRPRRRVAVALAGHCHAYELVGGLFAKALEEYGSARRLVASWLPSNTTDEMRLVVDDLGVRIKDFALDPAQDLIVLLEHRPAAGPSANTSAATAGADIRVHLRKLSAGAVAPHPAAKVPVLCRRALGPVHGCMIQIVEDVVGMYFWMPLHGVLIWNWMTGEELVVRLFSVLYALHPSRTTSSFKRTRRRNASGTFRSSHRERTWSRRSKTAVRYVSTALRLLRRPDDQRTSRHCTSQRRTPTAHCSSSRRRRGPSSRVRPQARRFRLRERRAFTSSRYTMTRAHIGGDGNQRASSYTTGR